jgi:zinc protease
MPPSDMQFTRLTLSNGLMVLLKEITTAPIISHWVWYRLGSRDEPTGLTGISHWTEHMQFKGTPQFPAKVMDKGIARDGGYWNAFTYLDWTTYFETMPANKIDFSIQFEADRMQHSLFDEGEVASERTVIISERQGNENEPTFRLGEEVQNAAFRVHPYHHEIIGDMADLQRIQRDDLYRHYRSYYTPNNAVLAVAGDFDTEAMLKRIRELFEPIPASMEVPRLVRSEPAQTGERRVTVEGPGETSYAQVVYHAPQGSHPDFFAFSVLDSLLCGPSSLNIFGNGISNKTSRLYRALVEKELAVGVSGGLLATIDPYLYAVHLTIHPQRLAADALQAMDSEIERLQDAPPPEDEVARAVKQARAMFAYGSESITNQAYWLGFAEMFDTYDWFVHYLDRLAAVTPAEVQRIAQVYLRPQNRVLGTYLPTNHVGNFGISGSGATAYTKISRFYPPSLLPRGRRGGRSGAAFRGMRGDIKV